MKTHVLLFAVACFCFASCKNFLDEAPISQIGENAFYTNASEVEQGVIAIYDGLQNIVRREFALTEMRSDNATTTLGQSNWGELESFDISPTNSVVADYWEKSYNAIFRANKVLEHVNVVDEPELRNQYEAEARFCRAHCYFNLVRLFGGVPLVDKVIRPLEEDFFARNSTDQVYDLIIADLESAVPNLPPQSGVGYGRATRDAAKALLGKVYLSTQQYAKASTIFDEVVSSLEYKLEENYHDVFYDEMNEEVIFAVQFIGSSEDESQDFSFHFTSLGTNGGLNTATDELISAFPSSDSLRYNTTFNPNAPEEAGKFICDEPNSSLCGNDWIVLRYADVLLMKAEAILGSGLTTSNEAALDAVNQVRQRAAQAPINELSRSSLLYERRLELAFENHRLFDLMRFQEAENMLAEFAENNNYSFSSTDLLLPIPQREIDASNGLLIQNPGY